MKTTKIMLATVACVGFFGLLQAANEFGSPQSSSIPMGDITECPSYCMKQVWTEVECVGSQASDCHEIPWYISSQTPGTCVRVSNPVFDPWYNCN